MDVFRLQKAKHKADITGSGAIKVSGRWHKSGSLPMLYTSSSISLAMLEVLVHLPSGVPPPRQLLLTIHVPDDGIKVIHKDSLPIHWNERGYFPEVQEWGMEWLLSKSSLAISVPSAISRDPNILLNPLHPVFAEVKVLKSEVFVFDGRLL